MDTLIRVQDEYTATVVAAKRRWAHSNVGGHAGRIIRGANKAASKRLAKLGLTDAQIRQAIRDAYDMAELELICEG